MGRRRPPLIEVDARETRRALRSFEGGLDDLRDAHREVGELVVDAAQGLVPVVSGDLLDTIRAARRTDGATVLAGRSAVPYAGPIHFGWPARGIAADPFLYDAADDRRDEIVAAYDARVDELVRRYDRMTPDR